jgi:hypothetical protein
MPGRAGGSWLRSVFPPDGPPGLVADTGAMADRAAASNTQATQVRALAKINTQVTRTRRHSAAHGGTTARIGLQAK